MDSHVKLQLLYKVYEGTGPNPTNWHKCFPANCAIQCNYSKEERKTKERSKHTSAAHWDWDGWTCLEACPSSVPSRVPPSTRCHYHPRSFLLFDMDFYKDYITESSRRKSLISKIVIVRVIQGYWWEGSYVSKIRLKNLRNQYELWYKSKYQVY